MSTYHPAVPVPAKLAAILDRYPSDDPCVVANRLVDEALTLQDEGRLDEADALLLQAAAILGMAENLS